ncbi:hypothetical protein RCL1_004702 [Eukaryota sp. TZLM3-RCL]
MDSLHSLFGLVEEHEILRRSIGELAAVNEKEDPLSPSKLAYYQHRPDAIAFERTDLIPLPSFLFHPPFRTFYNKPFVEFSDISLNKESALSWFYYFNVFRSVFSIESSRQHFLDKFVQLIVPVSEFEGLSWDNKLPFNKWLFESNSTPNNLLLANIELISNLFDKERIDLPAELKQQLFDTTNDSDIKRMMSEYPLLTVELKTERTSSCHSDPMFQCAAYAVRYLSNNPIFLAIGAPSLLLLIDGTHIHCYSIARTCYAPHLANSKFTVSLITDFDFSRSYDSMWKQFCSFFVGLRKAVLDLWQHVLKMMSSIGSVHREPRLPLFEDCEIKRFTSHHSANLFDATCIDPIDRFLVKFVQGNYGKVVQDFLHEAGFAPKCLRVEKCGDWNIVFMKNLDSVRHVSQLNPNDLLDVRPQLQKILDLLADSSLVHGDFRASNLMVVNENSNLRVKVVDFDHAGIEGTVTYPLDIRIKGKSKAVTDFRREWNTIKEKKNAGTLTKPVSLEFDYEQSPVISWHPEVYPGGPITKQHDQHFLDLLFKSDQSLTGTVSSEEVCQTGDESSSRHRTSGSEQPVKRSKEE